MMRSIIPHILPCLYSNALSSARSPVTLALSSTLLVVWLSVLLVRLLGEAAGGNIGADVVLVLAALSTITALPTILAVSVFIAVLTTVTRNYRESEMVVWFASGLSLADWFKPVLRVAIPVAIAVAGLTLFAAPWAYRQIGEYHQRFEQRSDLSRSRPASSPNRPAATACSSPKIPPSPPTSSATCSRVKPARNGSAC